MSNFNMDKYREMLYGKGISVDIHKSKKLAKEMMKEFPKGGSVFLDDYTSEEVRVARKLYNEKQKHSHVEWHHIVAWNKFADFTTQYLDKGHLVYVEGSIRTREWQNKQHETKKIFEIVATNIISLEKM